MTRTSRQVALATGIAAAFLATATVLSGSAVADEGSTPQPVPTSASPSTSTDPAPTSSAPTPTLIYDPVTISPSVIVDPITVPPTRPARPAPRITASLGPATSTVAAPSTSASLGSAISTHATPASPPPTSASTTSVPPVPSTVVDEYCPNLGFVPPGTPCDGQTTDKPGAPLANTGSPSLALFIAGGLLSAGGIGLLVVARRRSPARP